MGPLAKFHARLGALAARWPFRFAVFSLLSLAATWPMLVTAGALNEFRDAHILVSYEEVARRTVLDFGQFPLWNPYYCGGIYGLGAPQTRFASPTLLVSLLFGTYRAEALLGFLLILATFEGTFRYVRARGATAATALLAAPVFALSGFLAASPFLGWTQFYSFGAIPFAVLGARRAAEGKIHGAVLAGLSFAFMVGFGGTYPVPLTALLCAAEFIDRGIRRPRAALVGHAVLAVLLVAGLCLYRLWPVMETLQRAPRIIGGMSGSHLSELLNSMFGSPPVVDRYSWHLVGVLCIPAALSALLAGRRQLGGFLMLAGCIWLSAGYQLQPSLFAALRKLPVYSTLRYPDRFLVLAAVMFACLAGAGLTALFARARRNRRRAQVSVTPPFTWLVRSVPRLLAPLVALLLVGNAGVLLYNWHLVAKERTLGPPPKEIPGEFKQSRGSRYAVALFPAMNLGVLSCYEGYAVPQSPLLSGALPQEEYLADPSAGTVQRTRWSPNVIELDVSLTKPARLLVNGNFHTGWKANVGEVVDHEGLLGVELPAGRHALTLRFLPRSAVGGIGASLTALAAAIFLVRRFRKGPRGREWAIVFAAALAPFAVAGLSFVFVGEAHARPFLLRSETGEPVVADAPPEGAVPFEVKMDRGVYLEAVKTHWIFPNGEPKLVLEIDWRMTEKPLKGHGVFVHVHTTSGERFTPDHPLISGVLSFDDAPLNKTLRDIAVISLSSKHWGKTMDALAGLWNIHGDGARLTVLDPGKADINEHRALVYRGPVPAGRLPDGGVIPEPPDAGAPDAGP